MIIKINGRVLEDNPAKKVQPVKAEAFTWPPATRRAAQDERQDGPAYESLRGRFNRVLKPIILNTVPLSAGVPAYAAGSTYSVGQVAPAAAPSLAGALQPVIGMLQELALPVGIGMAIWGLIEVMVGNPGGREKIKWALISYVGVFIVPFFFYQVRAAFSVMPML